MTSIPVAISRIWPNNFKTTMSQKQKTFYRLFITYVKSRRSSDDFVQKDESSSFSIYEIIDGEKGCYLNV